MASISHTSITGRKKSFERTRLIKRHVGTANSNEAAAASRFLVFNRLNSAKTLQRKNNGESGRWGAGRQDITIAFEQTAQHIQKRENENAECKQRAEQAFLPAFRTGKNTSQAKAIETMGKGAQVSLPETAVLITAHAALPANSSRENATAHRLRIVPAAASASLSAYCRAFSLPAAGPSGSVLLCSPFSNSWMVTPSMSATEGKREISGQLIPRSHFETALSVIFSMRAKSFCVICLSFSALSNKPSHFFGVHDAAPPYWDNYIARQGILQSTVGRMQWDDPEAGRKRLGLL